MHLDKFSEDNPVTAGQQFGLVWPGKKQAIELALAPASGELISLPGKGVGEETTDNIFIEGENLYALKLLQKNYAGRIHMIYIDPPYNTGKGFVYTDNFSETPDEYGQRGVFIEEGLNTGKNNSGRFHSKWLSMMYPRLLLARNLLAEDGVLIAHIDENELAHLELILKELFGEENNLGTIVWDKRNPKGDATGIASQHESILCFARNRELLNNTHALTRKKKNAELILKKAKEFFLKIGQKHLPDDMEKLIDRYELAPGIFKQYEKIYSLATANAAFSEWLKRQDFLAGEKAYSQIDEKGNVFQSVSMAWPNKKKAPADYFIPLMHPVTQKPCPVPHRGWRFPSKKLQQLLAANEIIFGIDEATQPRRKYKLSENMLENIPSVIPFGGSDDALFKQLDIPFENPKPIKLARELIDYFTKEGDIVLDFFAGSGTTAHAVYELAAAGKPLTYILIQLDAPVDKNNLAAQKGFRFVSEITVDRIRKSIDKVQLENKGKELNIGFKMWKVKS